MSADRNNEITRLLKRGLNHYGLGDLEAAIECWERARGLDPENHAVHDYLESAYQERGGAPPDKDEDPTPLSCDDDDVATRVAIVLDEPAAEAPAARAPAAETVAPGTATTQPPAADSILDPDGMIEKALDAYKVGELDLAWKALQRVAKADPERLDVQGYLQLVGNARADRWAKEIGDQGRLLRQNCTTQEMMKLQLHPEEGYLLSQIDGKVTISDLLSLSTTSRHRTLEMLARLIREKIVA